MSAALLGLKEWAGLIVVLAAAFAALWRIAKWAQRIEQAIGKPETISGRNGNKSLHQLMGDLRRQMKILGSLGDVIDLPQMILMNMAT